MAGAKASKSADAPAEKKTEAEPKADAPEKKVAAAADATEAKDGKKKEEGQAVMGAQAVVSAEELDHAASVERFIGQKVERRRVEGFNYHYTTLLDEDAPTPALANSTDWGPVPSRTSRCVPDA